MGAIKATWTNGQILPLEPVDWPEGSDLLVEPLASSEKVGMDESEWRDNPESIAEWIAAVEKIEPMIWAEGRAQRVRALPRGVSSIQHRGGSKANGTDARQ